MESSSFTKLSCHPDIPTIHIHPASSVRRCAQMSNVTEYTTFHHKTEQHHSIIESVVSSSVMGEPPAKQARIEEGIYISIYI